ncbi:hypothetical protein DPMN_144129 [Dreissena polymorpha]|uniref:Uncharacterized protein n=1 Tax=Dreissena polymorpha TaxID=45954 RepID=A0A9D4JKC0_DREPO|nr:hypothetical protein DPMN_144129 [Dreissena polymorpha]
MASGGILRELRSRDSWKGDLAENLRKFYCEAMPKHNEKKSSHCQSTTELNTTGTHWSIS